MEGREADTPNNLHRRRLHRPIRRPQAVEGNHPSLAAPRHLPYDHRGLNPEPAPCRGLGIRVPDGDHRFEDAELRGCVERGNRGGALADRGVVLLRTGVREDGVRGEDRGVFREVDGEDHGGAVVCSGGL
ncbi:hypothetical protein Dimus_036965 [Dionaea muscipula]